MMATRGRAGLPALPRASRAGRYRRARRRAVRRRRRQQAHHLVEQVAGPPPVQGADRERIAEAEGDELPGGGLPVGVVDLVDHEAHRRPGPPDDLGRGQVLLGHARRDVDHHEHDVGLGQGALGLLRSPWPRGRRRRPASPRCP